MSSSTKILVGKVSVEKVASKVKEILLDNENTDKIVDDDVWTVVKEFEAENGLNSAQIKHYNAFVYEHIQEVVSTFREIKITENDKTYIIEFQEVFLKPPFESDETGNKLYPTSALQRNITYAAALHCDITITPPSGEPSYYAKVFIGSIPVMVLSDLCNMTAICHDAQKLASKNENIYDIGGYFVVAPKGENSTGATAQRRVLGAQEKAAPNLIQVFATKRKHNPKFASYAEVKSSGNGIHTTTTIVGIIGNPQRIGVVLPWIDATEIPIGIVFKALGVETDREAVVFILGPNYQSDREALKFIVPSLEYSYEIGTQEEALFYIGIKARIFKDDDAEDGDAEDEDEKSALQKAERKKKKVVNDKKVRSDAIEYAKRLLSQEFLPHVGSGMDTYPQKAKYLGYIVQKLIWVVLNRQKPGLRDHYMAKRVMTSGELLTQQFYSAFRRLVMEITNNTRKALKNGNNVNILSWIKPTIITNAMNGAISGNNWASGGPTSKGISQTYEEFNHASCAANMRKQTVPMAAEGGKVIEPRDLHGSHFGIVCVTGDTMVLLADGFTWSRIDKLEGKPIMTVNPLTLENEPSGIHNYIKILPKKLLFVKDDCGREIKCTPDHPFLVHKNGKNEWKKAGELRKGDELIVSDVPSSIIPGNKLLALPLKTISDEIIASGLNKPVSEKIAGILAGLMGALFTDGHVSKKKYKNQKKASYQCEFYLGELSDAISVQEDIFKLGFGSSFICKKDTIFYEDNPEYSTKHSTWMVSKGGDFARMMVELGAVVGKKTHQTLVTPKWILNASKFVKKEWLSGFQGGDGSKIGFWKNQETEKLYMNPTRIKNSRMESERFFDDMKQMYEDLGVATTVRTTEEEYILHFEGTRENLCVYTSVIDYKYCEHKRRNSFIASEFLKHWRFVYNTLSVKYESVRHAESFSEKLGVTKAQYYKIRGPKNSVPRPVIDIKSFKTRSLSSGKAFSRIESIENIDLEPVYDFTTISDNHSFIANGFVTHNCPAETPEGKKAGLVKNMALTALITIGSSPAPVRKIIETILGTKAEENFPASLSWTRVFLNGSPLGETNTPADLVKRLVRYRRNAKLNPETSIAYFDFLNEIHISVDAGRMCRPLFVVEDGEMPFRVAEAEKLAAGEMTWTQLLASGMVEIVDKAEEENCVIAGFPSELENLAKTKNPLLQKITHCEIHPSLMFGIGGSIIPFPDHNQSPRNCYQASMGKQAVGTPFTNFRQVMSGTFHTMEYTQKPLCLSRAGSIVKFDEMPAGQNAIIAVMPRPYNEEDSIEMSDASVQRGFMVSYKWTCYYSEIREERRESFGIPQPETCDRIKGNTKNLTEEGFPKSGTIIKAGDVIIGKLVENEIGDALVASKKKRFGDSSIVYDHAWPARVDKIQIGTTGDGYKYIRVMLCQRRAPVVGDKFSARHGQKGTIGRLVSVEDLPFDSQGVTPDIIVNSLAFPSRMTIAMLLELLSGKVIISSSPLHEITVTEAINGEEAPKEKTKKPESGSSKVSKKTPAAQYESHELSQEFRDSFISPTDPTCIDATPFRSAKSRGVSDSDEQRIDIIRKEMRKYGFDSGDQSMTDGVTGKRLRCLVFFGPVFYQKLKHFVIDKVHGRARGGRTALMRQPKEGRALGGGLRIGVMERDCILAQGAASFERDRLMGCSDEFKMWVCDICGLQAHTENGGEIRECKNCGTNKCSNIRIPYGTKLVNQELMAMNIVPRMLTSNHESVGGDLE